MTKIIRQNNGGNIYFGTLKNQKIIVKESRANILTFVNLKSEELRKNEFLMSEFLNSANFHNQLKNFVLGLIIIMFTSLLMDKHLENFKVTFPYLII